MISVLTGDDAFALTKAIDMRVKTFVNKYGDLAVERVDGDEANIEHIFDAITSIPLLSESKMVIVRSVSAQKDFLDKLVNDVKVVPESTELVLIDAKLDKRAGYYKKLKQTVDFQDFSAAGATLSSSWVVEHAKDNSGSINSSDANYLIQRVGSNKTLLFNEITKLIAYNPAITRDSIDLLCEPTPQSTVFQLLDAAFSGNTNRAMKLYDDQRQQRIEPLAILSMVAWQLQSLAIVKTAGNRDVGQVAKESKLNPFVIKKSQSITNKMTLLGLRKLVRRALELDVKLKSTAVDADEAMRYFLLNLDRV